MRVMNMSNKRNKTTTAVAVTGEQPTVAATPATNKYVQLSNVPVAEIVVSDDVSIPTSINKRALAVALYLTVCEHIGVKYTANDSRAIRATARLLPYANIGYSKSKAHMLQGSEVTASGMLGYAKFVTKPDAAKLLPGGEGHSKVTAIAVDTLAKHLLSKYGKLEGIDTVALASK